MPIPWLLQASLWRLQTLMSLLTWAVTVRCREKAGLWLARFLPIKGFKYQERILEMDPEVDREWEQRTKYQWLIQHVTISLSNCLLLCVLAWQKVEGKVIKEINHLCISIKDTILHTYLLLWSHGGNQSQLFQAQPDVHPLKKKM